MASSNKPIVGISVGDLNGIGLEVIMKTFSDARMLDYCIPVVYGSSKVVSAHKKTLDLVDFSFYGVDEVENIQPKKVNMLNCWNDEVTIELGKPSPDSGKFALKSFTAAVDDLASNKIDVLVTAPVDKNNIHSPEFPFKGHTEYLANFANVENVLMVMCTEYMRVGVVSHHIPVKDVAQYLSVELIEDKISLMNKVLIQDFGILKPKIAVMGLNPHAGDNGLMGTEEKEIIIPAIEASKNNGILAFGPFGADGFFGAAAFKQFDGILCMYHDQGLIPFKALNFDSGVNYTAGLPVVRTSPDHGTGFDIAGKGIASESSFREAVFMACKIYQTRKEYKEITSNPLVVPFSNKEGASHIN